MTVQRFKIIYVISDWIHYTICELGDFGKRCLNHMATNTQRVYKEWFTCNYNFHTTFKLERVCYGVSPREGEEPVFSIRQGLWVSVRLRPMMSSASAWRPGLCFRVWFFLGHILILRYILVARLYLPRPRTRYNFAFLNFYLFTTFDTTILTWQP